MNKILQTKLIQEQQPLKGGLLETLKKKNRSGFWSAFICLSSILVLIPVIGGIMWGR